MIPVNIVPHVDLMNVVDVRVPGGVVSLPYAEWPTDGDAIDLPECTVARYTPPPEKPTFTKKALPAGLYALPEPPKAADAAPPVAPRAFVEWLASKLHDRGPVEPTPTDHPAHARLVAAYHARKITARGLNAGSNFDLDWAVTGHNLDLAVRMLALDGATVASLIGPHHAGEVARLQRAGASRPGSLRDEILADFDAEQEAARKEADRIAAARSYETELLTIDLAREGLIEVTTDDPRVSFGRVAYAAPKSRVLMLSHGIATGETVLHVPTRDGDGSVGAAKVKVRDTGTTEATRKDLAEVGALDDAIVKAVREERRPTKSYAAGDFTGNVQTLEGRHALHLLRARAAQLVHSLATAPHGAVGAFLMHLLLTVPVAFGGAVSLPNVVDAVQVALRDYVESKSIGRVYGPHGQPSEATPVEMPWPHGLLKPDEIPRAMLAALGRGSSWAWGECVRPPSPDEERRVRAELDPALWARTVEGAIAERAEVRSQDVYDALFAVGLIASPTPNAEQRGRVSDALFRSGWRKVQAKGDTSTRHWLWRRPARAATGPALEKV